MALADLKEGALRIESFQLDDVKVRVYGDAAVVTGLITEKSTVPAVTTPRAREDFGQIRTLELRDSARICDAPIMSECR